ncbi:MAG: hypothetical protein UV60_C0006G0022 [Parcubacteria group bacterium GW2011_GWA2_43_11]|nr:MAG: hypothetical protein UU89_C0005G0025 [Parcubacteria group bacterium GW2011_GWC2_42_11]KKS85670.1 MAG: hypothetical protein UV60_C0006G0022 [Parcubacteria group bacterium GW2011_GWA2_43_11]
MKKEQFGNFFGVTVAILFVVGFVAGTLYALICGNHYFTEVDVLAKIQEVNPYAVALEKVTYRIFEPSTVTVEIKDGDPEVYKVFSNIKRELTIEP